MKKLLTIKIIFILALISSCQTIKTKSDAIVEKENDKLSKFIGQPESELKIVMGKPNEQSVNEKGFKILIYKNKKFGISCERKFEIDENNMVIGFTSNGCF